jgi:antitoxin component of MazEF toxin-antitoxin module
MSSSYSLGTRKLQRVGNAFMLPLPITWVRNMNACKGDALKIEMLEDHSLRIIPN